MFILESKWGNDGYAAWFKILERLGESDNHVLDVNDPAEFSYLAAYCRVTTETLTDILNECSALNAIDRDFWRKKLIYSQNFVNRVRDAYRKRTNKLPSDEKLRSQYLGFPAEETPNPAEDTPQNEVSGVSNPQREREREREREIKGKKESKKKKASTQNFEKFWEVYPKKQSKGDAEKAFNAINPDELLMEKILSAVLRAKTREDWMKEKGKYIPYPATWLRAKGWEDEGVEQHPLTGIVSDKTIQTIDMLNDWSPPT